LNVNNVDEMERFRSIEVILGTYEELTLGYRLVTETEEVKVV